MGEAQAADCKIGKDSYRKKFYVNIFFKKEECLMNKMVYLMVVTMMTCCLFLVPVVEGSGWSAMSSGVTEDLHDIWGSSGSDIFAIGQNSIFHYNGDSWSVMTEEYSSSNRQIWGSAADNVYVTQDWGEMLYYAGSNWGYYTGIDYPPEKGCIWGSCADDIYVGDPSACECVHYNGETWSRLPYVMCPDVLGGSSDTNVYAASGALGTIHHYTGVAWGIATEFIYTPCDMFTGIWVNSEDEVFLTGEASYPISGVIVQYNGSNWSLFTTTTKMKDVWGRSATDVFAVGNEKIWHYDGMDWTTMEDLSVSINGIWGNSSTGVYGVGDSGTILHYEFPTPSPSPVPTPAHIVIQSGDYNGNGSSDIAVFRQENGLWAIRGLGRTYFGRSFDIPASGDYDADGIADVAIFRPSTGLWAVKDLTRFYLGSSGDISAPGDYDGDGFCDPAIFRESSGLWRVRGITTVYYGTTDDLPVPDDYDDDGTSDIAIFRASSGLWAVRGLTRVYFGGAGDRPIPAAYGWYVADRTAGPYRSQVAVYRSAIGLWAVQNQTRFYYGGSGDTPVPASFSGGPLADPAVFRGSTGLWAIRNVTRAYFGQEGDIPVTR